jgi:mRNA interferase RelE/StbE
VSYTVRVRPSARKDVGRLPQEVRRRVAAGIRALAEDPRGTNTKHLHGRLAGLRRLRVGDYRVLYVVDDQAQQIDVLRVGTRESVYER